MKNNKRLIKRRKLAIAQKKQVRPGQFLCTASKQQGEREKWTEQRFFC
jgi:hypothetical protein